MLDDATAAIIATDASCATCLFYVAGAKDNDLLGNCRRYPPVISSGEEMVSFPGIKTNDWCGEWTKKP